MSNLAKKITVGLTAQNPTDDFFPQDDRPVFDCLSTCEGPFIVGNPLFKGTLCVKVHFVEQQPILGLWDPRTDPVREESTCGNNRRR